MRQNYRSSVGIAIDIMTAIQEKGDTGIKISVIARVANLAHYACHDRLNIMIEKGLVQKIVIPGRTKLSGNKTYESEIFYKLTDLGHQVLSKLKDLETICKNYFGMSVMT